MVDERRKYKRKKVNSKVKVFHPIAGAFVATTKDISNGGILISAKGHADKIKQEDEAKVIFLNSGEVNVVFNMTIIRINKSEIAMEIINCEKDGKTFSVLDLRNIQR